MAPASMLTWQAAWSRALYGPEGFYRCPAGPAGHFRTAAHTGDPVLAEALLRLAAEHGCRRVIDLGAGRGELSSLLARADPGIEVHAVDVVPRPAGLPARIGWTQADPGAGEPLPCWPPGWDRDVLVIAWELLDVIPCPILEVDDEHRLRVVLVDPATGVEELGEPVTAGGRPEWWAWSQRWWPAVEPGERIEVGLPRDRLWAAIAARVRGGVLLAVDYGHRSGERPPGGSLSGFRAGRQVPPAPDGSCDLTAEVAFDSLTDAGMVAGAGPGTLASQRERLTTLAPGGTVRRELLDPGGWGGFTWLIQPVPA